VTTEASKVRKMEEDDRLSSVQYITFPLSVVISANYGCQCGDILTAVTTSDSAAAPFNSLLTLLHIIVSIHPPAPAAAAAAVGRKTDDDL